MFDNNDKNITYQAVAISSRAYLNGSTLDLNSLRKLTSKEDILLIKRIMVDSSKFKKEPYKEKYENHQFFP